MNNKLREIRNILFYGDLGISSADADRMAKQILAIISESEEEKCLCEKKGEFKYKYHSTNHCSNYPFEGDLERTTSYRESKREGGLEFETLSTGERVPIEEKPAPRLPEPLLGKDFVAASDEGKLLIIVCKLTEVLDYLAHKEQV